ncbi:MAG: hypothetical protein IPO07_02425 [Haliscomenobacter sp.]|nr:hypothetical protein [Haliscomenobacter sp.]MBK9487762.1 hypothetical protein [Haliscomenobacter sp.]
MHLNEDIAIFEKKYLDESRFIPIITDFTRSSQPIVRYELNDILVKKTEPCPCGSCFTALERIEGREDDILVFPGENGGMIKVFPDLICRVIARSAEGFRAYRLRQVGALELQLELESEDFQGVSATISQRCVHFFAGKRNQWHDYNIHTRDRTGSRRKTAPGGTENSIKLIFEAPQIVICSIQLR